MKFFTTTLFIFLLTTFGKSQEVDTKKLVQSMFESPSKIQWVKHFKGRIDDLNDVSMTLGFDGKNCLGRMTYLRSKVKFDLRGSITGNRIELVELDEVKTPTGLFRGQISGEVIQFHWNNIDKSKGGKLWLTETNIEAKIPGFCGDNKWVRKYKGKLDGQKIELLLQKESQEKIIGLIYYNKQQISHPIKGSIDPNGVFEMKIKNQRGQKTSTLNGILSQDQITFENKDGKKTTFAPQDGLTIGCIEYADYMTGYDITYPKTTNADFNRLMNEETSAWIKACRSHAKRNQAKNISGNPKNRSTERGYAWTEVDFFSKKIISGFMTFSNTWTPGQKLVAYNYDLKKNNMMYLEDIFTKEKNYKKYIQNYIKKEIKKHQLYSDSDFKKWVKKSDFPFFTIRRDGICFSTKNNMIYGRQSVTIPYRQLQPFLKKSFVKLVSE